MTEENELVRLEKFVSTLLEKFNVLQVEKKELTDRLLKRDATLETLETSLASLKAERGEISTRVSSIIDTIENWESTIGFSTADTCDTEKEKGTENEKENNTESGDNASDTSVQQGNLFTVNGQRGQFAGRR